MTTLIYSGTKLYKDPNAVEVFTVNWNDDLAAGVLIQTSTFTITGPDGVLTKDNEAIGADTRSTRLRLLGGTLRKTYTVLNRIVTNETPSQTKDASFLVAIQEK